jgi:hypothetical protein
MPSVVTKLNCNKLVHFIHVFAESFAMGKLHKDIALAMVQLAENEESTDQDIIKVHFTQLDKFFFSFVSICL